MFFPGLVGRRDIGHRHGQRTGRPYRRHTRAKIPFARSGRGACSRPYVFRRGGHASLRRPHRLELPARTGRTEGGQNGAVSRHRRGVDFRPANSENDGRAGNPDLVERRKAGAGQEPRSGRTGQLSPDARMGSPGYGANRRQRRRRDHRNRWRRNPGENHRSNPHRRNHQLDRRSHRRRHQPDRGDAQIDPPAGSLRRQPAHVRGHERGIHPQPAAPGYRPGV